MKETLIDGGNGAGTPAITHRRQRATAAGEDLNGDDFESFLTWLAPNRDGAGQTYEKIRSGLIKTFLRHECASAEELADETINRVIRSVHRIANSYVGDPMPYFYAVARRLRCERQRRPVTVPWEETRIRVEVSTDESGEDYDRRLEQALNMLAPHDRDLVIRYYQGAGRSKIDHRQQLADELGIGLNALRIRVHRIRTELKRHMGL
jgi:DNA-directed RNA polymerase specialized sigma24 family protein